MLNKLLGLDGVDLVGKANEHPHGRLGTSWTFDDKASVIIVNAITHPEIVDRMSLWLRQGKVEFLNRYLVPDPCMNRR